jgi:transposase
MSKVSRLEVIQAGARRRWTLAEKQRIVAESESGPRQVSATARRYGVLPSQLFTWRRLAREGRLGANGPLTFAQAVIACEPALKDMAAVGLARNRIEIVLVGGLRVVVEDAVDPNVLARLIGALERR